MSDEDEYDAEDDEIKAQRKILELLEKEDDDVGVAIEYNSAGEDGEKPNNRNGGMNGKINGAAIDEEDEEMMGDDY